MLKNQQKILEACITVKVRRMTKLREFFFRKNKELCFFWNIMIRKIDMMFGTSNIKFAFYGVLVWIFLL